MPRLMLSDEFWSKLEKILLQEAITYNKQQAQSAPIAAAINMMTASRSVSTGISRWSG